jgi:hypothetical protein
MLTPLMKVKQMKFNNVNVKDPSEDFLIWLSNVILPKSNYLSKKVRGKKLLEIDIDSLEYIAFKCKSCNDLLKKQAKYLYFIKLYENMAKYEIEEYEFDELVKEYIGGE